MPRTPGRARQRKNPHPATAFPTSLTHFRPTLDATRYAHLRSGMTEAEIAARENVSLATVTRSIERMKMQRELYSKESVETATRQSVLSTIPTATNSLLAALTATRDKILAGMDDDGNETVEVIQEADHALRLKAIDTLTKLIESTKESSPMISANFNNQNLQQNAIGVGANGQPIPSFESIVRTRRQELGLGLPEDEIKEATVEILPDSIDFELAADLAELGEEDDPPSRPARPNPSNPPSNPPASPISPK